MQKWKIIHMRNFWRCSIETVQDVFNLKLGRNSTKYFIIGIICVFNYLFINIIKCNYLNAYVAVFYNIFRSCFLRIEENINFWFWFSLDDLSSPSCNFFLQFFNFSHPHSKVGKITNELSSCNNWPDFNWNTKLNHLYEISTFY